MYQEKLNQLKEEGLYRSILAHDRGTGPVISVNGKEYISFSSNNYLGLAAHPSLIKAGQLALEKYGAGSGASRLLSGTMPPHQELEQEIATFKETEAALLFGSGYMANLAILTTLARQGDLILSDRSNHASLIDGCRLSQATFKIFKHRDMDHLKYLLSKKPPHQKTLIVTEGVFSMDGDLAPLPEMVLLAKAYRAQLMVDDAHGMGTMGDHGRGTAEYFGVEKEIEIQMGTLGKAAGVYGAFIAGSKHLIDYLINRAKPFIYTTALPPVIASMCTASLKIISQENSLRKGLRNNQVYLSEKLLKLGFSIHQDPSPIIPLICGDIFKTVEFSKRLLDSGIFIPAIRPPTVPEGMCRLRISLMATHTKEQLDECLKNVKHWGKYFELI